jgi:hypothetical protein
LLLAAETSTGTTFADHTENRDPLEERASHPQTLARKIRTSSQMITEANKGDEAMNPPGILAVFFINLFGASRKFSPATKKSGSSPAANPSFASVHLPETPGSVGVPPADRVRSRK